MLKKILVLVMLLLVAADARAALTLTRQRVENAGSETKMEYTVGFDSSYASGGESLTAANVGLTSIHRVSAAPKSGYVFAYDYSANKLRVYNSGTAINTQSITLTDDNTAATNGRQLYVDSVDGVYGYLNTTLTADGTGTLATSGSTYIVRDDSTGGTMDTALYFDEDAANVDERFLSNFKSQSDHFINVGNGTCIRVKHSATASSLGVPVYFKETGTAYTAKLLFVSPTNVAGTGRTDDSKTNYAGSPVLAEIDASTNLSALTGVEIELYGK